MPTISTSTIITQYAPQAIQYIWDTIIGFIYTANFAQFIVVFIILVGVVCLVVASIKYIFPTFGKHKL